MPCQADPKDERGSQYYPSPERMQEIEEVFRKMGLDTEEKRREMRSQGYTCEPEKPSEKCWVTSLSNHSIPYNHQG